MSSKNKKSKQVNLRHPDSLKDKEISPLSGSKSEELSNVIATQVANTLWLKHSNKEEQNNQMIAALSAVIGAKPQDELEGMLAAQMVAAHNASMECFRRAMSPDQTFDGREMNLNQANKLTRSYAALMEALNRYRGNGQQKMTVEHVHVHAGGQAIVGNVTRPEGGGVQKKTEEQPHAKRITHTPMQEMPSQHTQRQTVFEKDALMK
jgi:hypothetical protein